MAEENKDETQAAGEEEAEASKPKKKAPLFVGGVIGLLGLAYVASLMALPGKQELKRFKGPFVSQLMPEKISVNLDESSRKRYLQFNLTCFFMAYEEGYFTKRTLDPLFEPLLQNAVMEISSSKTVDDVYDKIASDVFLEEIRDSLEGIMFPITIGSGGSPTDYDTESGLRPSPFTDSSTFRGSFYEHELHVDGPGKTLQLDDGEKLEFEGDETKAELRTSGGDNLYVDVSMINEEFEGSVMVGTHGTIGKILWKERIVQ